MQSSLSEFPRLGKYKVIEELEKSSICTIYRAINNSTKKFHLVKIFNIPKNKFNSVQLWVLQKKQLLSYLKELPNNISYDRINYIIKSSQVILAYHPNITTLNSLKYQLKSNSLNESLTPEQAFYSFVLILENYKAILKRTREPFSLRQENIILFRDNLTIDYVSNQLIDIIHDDNDKSQMGEDQFKKSLGMLLYDIIYQEQGQPTSDNCKNSKSYPSQLIFYDDKYNKYGLNNAIKILLKNDNQNLSDTILSILTALKIEGKNHDVIKHLEPVQQQKLKYIWGISDEEFLQEQSLEEFQIYLLNSVYYGNFDLFTDLIQVFDTTSQYNEINGIDSIYQAAQQNNIKAFIILSKQFKIPMEEYNKISLIVSQLGHLEIIKHLIQEIKVDINYCSLEDMTILLISAQVGHLEIVKYLIEDIKIDSNQINDNGRTPLLLSAQSGHLQVVKYFIEDIKINPNQTTYWGDTSLLLSSEQGHLQVVKYLIEDIKIDPNQTNDIGNTPLLQSAYAGHLEIMKYLIEDIKIDPNQTNDTGYTPLLQSAKYGHLEIVKYLIEDIKVDPNQTDYYGNTPLLVSAREGHLEVVKYLIEDVKINVNQSNENGNTPLLLSAREGHLQVVKYLIEDIKIDPNQTDNNSNTPLLLSTKQGHLEIVKYLIKRADINLNHVNNQNERFWNVLNYDSPQIFRIIIEDKQVLDALEFNPNEQSLLNMGRSKSFFKVTDILESI